MPNRYQREIEEILRNMDSTDTRTGVGDRVRTFNRPRRRARSGWSLNLNLSRTEAFILSGIVLILIAAGITYYFASPTNSGQFYLVGDWLSINGILALAGFLSIVVGLALDWRDRFRGITPRPNPTRSWRSPTVIDDSRDSRDSKDVVDIGSRRGPLTGVSTRVRLLRLKLRYLRTRGHD